MHLANNIIVHLNILNWWVLNVRSKINALNYCYPLRRLEMNASITAWGSPLA